MKQTNHTALVRGIVAARADASGPSLSEINAAVEGVNRAFKEFRTKTEEGLSDVVRTEELARINDSISGFEQKLADLRAQNDALRLGGGGDAVDPAKAEHRKAFDRFVRSGAEAGLRDLQVSAKLTTQSDPDGGFLVPSEMDSTITRVLGTVSALRSVSRVISVGTSEYAMMVSQGGTTSGWVGEEDARAETSTPTLSKIVIHSGECYAQPAATQVSLEDAMFDLEAWLAGEIATEFAEEEGAAFVSGNGVNKPRGILSYDTVANASYAWGKLGFVVTGAAAAFSTPSSTSSPADALIALYYSLKSGYRDGAAFVTSDAVLGTMRQFKDGQGNYLWAPPTADMPGTILGKPVVTDDNMPALAANAFPVAFGNFQRGYTIADRIGTSITRDPYTSKPNVLFYARKRVGGAVSNFEAIKLLKCST